MADRDVEGPPGVESASAEEGPPGEPGKDDDDLETFRSWLENLKQ
jgi:hypothetical protein